MNEPRPSKEGQVRLREIFLGVTVIAAMLGVSRIVGGLGGIEIAFFAFCACSFCLASRNRRVLWLGVGVALTLPIALLAPVGNRALGLACGMLLYSFAGAPVAIAVARRMRLRRWLVSEFGILSVSVALTPADIITSFLVFVPLQAAVILYSLVGKDGNLEPGQATQADSDERVHT